MKFLATADIHLFNWQSYNQSWDGDIPSRLIAYDILADEFIKIAKENDIYHIIIAGDLFHDAILRPMVEDAALSFLKKLEDANIVVFATHGQHDIDSKSDKIDPRNSMLTIISRLSKTKYFHDEHTTFLELNPPSIYFLGYEPKQRKVSDLPNADIFIGHGIVSASTNSVGHVFSSGFNAEELSKKYKMSIIGDIHHGQTFFGNVVIPGTPIQHGFGDGRPNGVIIVDTGDWSTKFVPIENPIFPKFITVVSKEEIKPENNVFYKVKPEPSAKGTKSNNLQVMDPSDIREVTRIVVESLRNPWQDRILKRAYTLLDEISAEGQANLYPPVKVTGIDIKNFRSIKSLKLDFDDSKVLILGDVGSGKSSVLTALSWGLFGKTVEDKRSVEMFYPVTFDPSPGMEVTVSFDCRGNKYKILRTFWHKKLNNSLVLLEGEGDNVSEIKKSSMGETQKFIEEILGISFDDFVNLCYYYQKKSSFFGSMSPGYQSYLMMKFLGGLEDILYRLGEAAKEKVIITSTRTHESKGAINQVGAQISGCNTRLGHLRSRIADESRVRLSLSALVKPEQMDAAVEIIRNPAISVLTKCEEFLRLIGGINGNTLSDFEAAISESRTSLTLIDGMLNERRSTQQMEEGYLNSADTFVTDQQKQIESLEKNECYACHRQFDAPPNKKQIKKHQKDIKSRLSEREIYEKSIKGRADELIKLNEKRCLLQQKLTRLNDFADLMSTFKKVVDQCSEDNSQEIISLEAQVSDYEKQRASLAKESEVIQEDLAIWNEIQKKVFSNSGVNARALESIGDVLSTYMNQLLMNANSPIKIEIKTVTWSKSGKPSSKLEIKVDFGDGKILGYNQLSGGQSMLIDALSIVGFYNVLSDKHDLEHGLLGFLAMDEIIQFVDERYIDVIKSILEESAARTTLLISHNPALMKLFDRVIRVKLVDNISQYEVQNA